MKKILYVAIVIATFASCTNEKGYTIQGYIEGAADGKAIITNNAMPVNTENLISDTTDIIGGKFTFKGKVTTPEFYALTVDKRLVRFFLDNNDITIVGHLDAIEDVKISGSSVADEITAMNNKRKALDDDFEEKYHINALLKEYRLPETTAERKAEIEKIYDELEPEMEAAQKEIRTMHNEYITNNPTSVYTPILVQTKINDYTTDELVAMVNKMMKSSNLKGNRYVKELKETVDILVSVEVGKQAPDFTQNDPDDNPITFSDIYKNNKVTMLDFWAGWCSPCRQFNPTLVQIYEKYHDKGFEILGVSMDRTKEQWTKAIADDNLTWPQVSSIEYWQNPVGKLYYIRYIPQNVFVDQNGIIIAKKIGEEEIEKLLEEKLQ
jgi:Thiol-disulfide isomerase and thioredoxins